MYMYIYIYIYIYIYRYIYIYTCLFIALFKEEGLSLIIETSLIEADFLDVTFSLATKKLSFWKG